LSQKKKNSKNLSSKKSHPIKTGAQKTEKKTRSSLMQHKDFKEA
jgi:hypothetical protein